jgi:hypothetical protein
MPRRSSFAADVRTRGYAIVSQVLSGEDVARLRDVVDHASDPAAPPARRRLYLTRGLLDSAPAIRQLARSPEVRRLVDPVLGRGAFAVRGLLFDKSRGANWVSPWHQDVAISVAARIDVPGFSGWSPHAGVVHVQPPAGIQERMLAVRIHLDDCTASQGPLRVVPRSHTRGYLTPLQIRAARRAASPVSCLARAGDVVLMKPLLLHASSRSASSAPRRVIHLQFAACELPGGLRWSLRCGGS